MNHSDIHRQFLEGSNGKSMFTLDADTKPRLYDATVSENRMAIIFS